MKAQQPNCMAKLVSHAKLQVLKACIEQWIGHAWSRKVRRESL